MSETNHERTLYVPYVFRNYLISRQQNDVRLSAAGKTESMKTSKNRGLRTQFESIFYVGMSLIATRRGREVRYHGTVQRRFGWRPRF
jgi:hypothetical protein